MNLKTWCELVSGRQTELAAYLKKSPSVVSQAVTGTIRVPPSWYRGIAEFTQGDVGFDDLVPGAKRKTFTRHDGRVVTDQRKTVREGGAA